jgi:energy-coupling factor transporter transmembrane protein EcfT
MVAKGYTGKPTIITENKMNVPDYAFVSIVFILALAIHFPIGLQSGTWTQLIGL